MSARIYHFLGSVSFALILIGTTALFVIAGTFIESASGSHRYAAFFTYGSPVFAALLCGFFLNILISALRRWPFKKRHIPFLITHLGLLMLLGGALLKNFYGVQGVMYLKEGSASSEILLPDSPTLLVEPPNLKYTIVHTLPHAKEKQETWIKGSHASIRGVPPVPINSEGVKAYFGEQQWTVRAVKSDDPEKTLREAYLHGLKLRVVEAENIVYEGPLDEKLVDWETDTLIYKDTKIPLKGPESLIHRGSFQVDLMREPTLLFIQQPDETSVILLDKQGRIHREKEWQTLVAYDRGFGGYAVQLQLPYFPQSRSEIEQERLEHLKKELQSTPEGLSPPLKFLLRACQDTGSDFPHSAVSFLDTWNRSHSWLYPKEKSPPELVALDWSSLSKKELQGLLWIEALADKLEPELKKGADLLDLLRENQWPFLQALQEQKKENRLTHLSQQIFMLADELPPLRLQEDKESRLFSAYLRVYDLHLSSIPYGEVKKDLITLETPLTVKYEPLSPSIKLEENRPVVTVKATHEGKTSFFSLGYDPSATGLKWPLFDGAYRVRYQPQTKKLPVRIRLRQARQISYPGTNQPYSFESDLLINENGREKEVTISMNNVYETRDGYRFYMANLTPAEEGALKQVQLVVNYDPAKYWLTYPGGILLALGIFLLFFARKLTTIFF